MNIDLKSSDQCFRCRRLLPQHYERNCVVCAKQFICCEICLKCLRKERCCRCGKYVCDLCNADYHKCLHSGKIICTSCLKHSSMCHNCSGISCNKGDHILEKCDICHKNFCTDEFTLCWYGKNNTSSVCMDCGLDMS